MVADAEQLPFPSESFDLGYSFGVLHHSPNTEKAVSEIVRVVRPGGQIKVMLYNRHCIYVFNQWVKHALLRGKPWKTLRWTLWHHMESIGTKGYTRRELCDLLGKLPLKDVSVHTEITSADYLSASAIPPLNAFYRLILRLAGYSWDWDLGSYVERPVAGEPIARRKAAMPEPNEFVFSGNRLDSSIASRRQNRMCRRAA